MQFNELYLKTVKPEKRFIGKLLALDPGETTGWSLWDCTIEGAKLLKYGQLLCTPFDQGIVKVDGLIKSTECTRCVYEDYKVYSWKSAAHSWESLHTPQLIGTIRSFLLTGKIPYSKQMAQVAKGFCTDDKLQEWGFWMKGQRHARDSIRHALYCLLFEYPKLVKL